MVHRWYTERKCISAKKVSFWVFGVFFLGGGVYILIPYNVYSTLLGPPFDPLCFLFKCCYVLAMVHTMYTERKCIYAWNCFICVFFLGGGGGLCTLLGPPLSSISFWVQIYKFTCLINLKFVLYFYRVMGPKRPNRPIPEDQREDRRVYQREYRKKKMKNQQWKEKEAERRRVIKLLWNGTCIQFNYNGFPMQIFVILEYSKTRHERPPATEHQIVYLGLSWYVTTFFAVLGVMFCHRFILYLI